MSKQRSTAAASDNTTHVQPQANTLSHRVELTVSAVNWDTFSTIICRLCNVTSAKWGDRICGGYHIVRFLHLDDDKETILVARVPYRVLGGWTIENASDISSQISSEVAKYVESHTNIPLPRILHYSAEADGGGVGSPYILMTKVDGVPLSSLWANMEDPSRESVLRQVVDILLELSFQRFEKIGSLFHRDGGGTAKDAWYVGPEVEGGSGLSSVTYTSGTDFWIAQANETLRSIHNVTFGSTTNDFGYAMVWFMRSLIPAIYDNSLDATGFPLNHGDFHSQNIMVTDVDSEPRITAIIDWESSYTHATSSFAQYPFFIVDHPLCPLNHPLRARNVRDQATFLSLLRQAEAKANITPSLSCAYEHCLGVYLFEQAIDDEVMFAAHYNQLFAYFFGGEEPFHTDYYKALMDHGLLKREAEQLRLEANVRREARVILGDDLVVERMSKIDFKTLVQKHLYRFAEGHPVREWLAVEGGTESCS